jgi:multiple sugar transport system permease protein
VRALGLVCLLTLGCLAAAEPVTIRYACMDGAESLPVIRQIVREFEQANPDVKVRIEPTTDEYAMKMLTQVAAKAQPDVAWMNVALVPGFAVRGVLAPLDDWVARSPDVKLEGYYSNVVRYFRTNGKLYGLPRDVAPFGLVFYNKTLFDRAGVRYPDPDWSWTRKPRPELREKDFTWVMKALTRKDPSGKTVQWGFAPAWPQLFFNLLLLSRQKNLWDSDKAPKRITANDPEIVRVMEFASDAILKQNWIPSYYQLESNAQSSPYDEFVKGHIAMLVTFAGEVGRLRKDMKRAGFDWDVAVFPGYAGSPPVLGTDAGGTVVFKSTKHPEAAWRFAKWMSGKPGMRHLAKTGMQPAIRRLVLEPGVWLPSEGPPEHLYLADKAAAAMHFAQTPEYFEDTRVFLDGAAFDILSGSRPPAETLARVTREAQVRLDAALRKMPKDPYPFKAALAIGVAAVAGLGLWLFPPGRPRRTRLEKEDSRAAFGFLFPLVSGLLVFTIGPILYSLFLSLSNADNIRPPLWRGVQNYVDAFTVDPVFLKSIQVSATYALLSVPLNIAFALGLALLLNLSVRGMPLYRAFFYLPSLVSGVTASLIWMRVFHPENGILNRALYWPDGHSGLLGLGELASSLAGKAGEPVNWLANERTAIPAFVMMGLWGAGAGTILFLAGLQGISKSYDEAAMLDGASSGVRFWRVTLPLLSPTMFFSLVTGTIGALQAFTQSFVMTQGGPNNATMFYMLNLYIQGFKSLKLGYASALAWILFLMIAVLTLVQFAAARRWVHYEGDVK